MGCEQQVAEKLVKQFPFLEGKVRTPRDRRLFVEIEEMGHFRGVLEYLYHQEKFNMMCTMTGLDEGEKMAVIYHIAHIDGTVANLKIWVMKNDPVVNTVLDLYEGCAFYEKELIDLLGFRVEGLPPGDRYPLPEDWPEGQFPLRKDWNSSMLKNTSNPDKKES